MTDETARDGSGALDRTTMTRATLLKAGAAVAAGSALLTGRAEASEVAVTPARTSVPRGLGVRLRHRDGRGDLADRRLGPGARPPASPSTSTASSTAAGAAATAGTWRARSSRRPTAATAGRARWCRGTSTGPACPRVDIYARATYGNWFTALDRGHPGEGHDRPEPGEGAACSSADRPRSRARTSSRCSARTCSRACWPTRPTAATRTWSAGSTSASPATRWVAATRTPTGCSATRPTSRPPPTQHAREPHDRSKRGSS